MTTGPYLGISLLILFSGWLIIDWLVWAFGFQTLSQWIIKKAREDAVFALLALLFILILGALLIAHFELVEIILAHLGIYRDCGVVECLQKI